MSATTTDDYDASGATTGDDDDRIRQTMMKPLGFLTDFPLWVTSTRRDHRHQSLLLGLTMASPLVVHILFTASTYSYYK